MGQQQLLLIVLGVIIVGIAIVVGINLFTANAIESNRNGVISDLSNLGAMAQQYYKRPTTYSGGGNTFTGWTLDANLDTTGHGTYALTVNAQSVTIVGTGYETGDDGSTKVKATATVTPTSITIAKNN